MPTPSSTIGIYDFGVRSMIFSKFGSFMNLPSVNEGVIFFPKDVAQREFAEKKGRIELDFANVWRTSTKFSQERQRTPVGRKGMSLQFSNSSQTQTTTAVAAPVDLVYEVTFWTLDPDKMQEITEEYMFWIYNNPNLELSFNGFPMELDLHFKDVTDSSTVGNMYKVGKYFVQTFTFSVDGWLPRFTDLRTILSIEVVGYTGYQPDNIEVFRINLP